jgi:tetratricopeptide (TPR) repeat protein
MRGAEMRNPEQIPIHGYQGHKHIFWSLGIWLLIIVLNSTLGFGSPSPCYAGGIESSFYTANSLYEQGSFDNAIKQYDSILESGFESGNLYYNLGNCYFKKGELGRALLNYEKARRLIPLDKDLESNYEYARSLIKGGGVSSGMSLFFRVFNNFFEKFTINGLTVLVSAFYILILVSVLTGLFLRPFKRHALILAVFTGLFFAAACTGLAGKIALLNKEAIVIAGQADAKFEPMDKATAYFTLYEGMKAELIASKDNWHKVRRQDNKSGWVENSAIAIF